MMGRIFQGNYVWFAVQSLIFSHEEVSFQQLLEGLYLSVKFQGFVFIRITAQFFLLVPSYNA